MEIMSDPNWSESRNPMEIISVTKLVLTVTVSCPALYSKLKRRLAGKEKKSKFTDFLPNPVLYSRKSALPVHDLPKSITNKGEHKAWEELQKCEWKLQKHEKNFFEKIEGGDWHKGELIENEFEGLKLSLKMLEMLKHLVQSALMEPMRDAVVLVTLMYIVVLAYSLAQVRNDWLIHFLVLCAFVCLHIGSYFSEKAANYFYRVKEMEKKLTERRPHDVVLYLHLASPTCILPST